MAAELFSTSLLHNNEVEVKKGFIQSSEPKPLAKNHDDDRDDAGGAQPNVSSNDREERDGWQETQPTLRERSAQYSAPIGQQQNANSVYILPKTLWRQTEMKYKGNVTADRS